MNTIKISKLLDKTTDLKDEDITIVSSNENPSANIGDANYMTLKNKPTINQFVNDLISNVNITNNQFANYNSSGYYHIADTYDQLLTLMIYGKDK